MKSTGVSVGIFISMASILGITEAIANKPPTEVMHKTFNNLTLSIRKAEGVILQQSVVNAMDLAYQVKQAHWTLKGATFLPIHEFFDDLEKELLEFIDVIAERQEQLGGTIYGTVRVAAKTSTLPEYPLDTVEVKDHILAICKVLSAYIAQCRDNIRIFADLKDDVSSEIFITITRALDKKLWLLESHLNLGVDTSA